MRLPRIFRLSRYLTKSFPVIKELTEGRITVDQAYDEIRRLRIKYGLSVPKDAIMATWEKCMRCGEEYRAGHLCRLHGLCGLCHESDGVTPKPM